MKLFKALLIFFLCLASGFSQATNNYQDWWWNPAQSGMGLNVGQQNDTIFVAWFNYGEDTKASFLTMGGVLSGNTLTGPLYRNTGPVPGPNYNPALVKQTAVGTATITFNSNNDATLTYSYDNKGGSMALQRFSFANPNLNQTWIAIDSYITTGCDNASDNGVFSTTHLIKGSNLNGDMFNLSLSGLGGTDQCVLSLTGKPSGSRLTAQGQVTCPSGGRGANVIIHDLNVQADYLNFSYSLGSKPSESQSCVQKGTIAGVVQKILSLSYDFNAAKKSMLLKGVSKTFNITGDCNATFSRFDSPATRTVWNGQSVYAVGTTEIVNMPASCPLGSAGSYTSVTYYDLDFAELAKLDSDGYYSEYKPTSTPAPLNALVVGDTGVMGTWLRWNNASRTTLVGSEIWSFIIEPDSPTSIIFNLIDRTFDNQNTLKNTVQIRYRIFSNQDFEVVSMTSDLPNNAGHLVGR